MYMLSGSKSQIYLSLYLTKLKLICPNPTSVMLKRRSLITEFSDLFMSPRGELGCTTMVNHNRISNNQLGEFLYCRGWLILHEVQKMLEQGVVRPSHSPWSSCTYSVMVQKKDGSWRFCVDFRNLNAVTHRDAYPLPRIDSTLDMLKGSTLFTMLDLQRLCNVLQRLRSASLKLKTPKCKFARKEVQYTLGTLSLQMVWGQTLRRPR